MLSIEYNLITSDIKLVSYSPTITMMHGPIYIRHVKKFYDDYDDMLIDRASLRDFKLNFFSVTKIKHLTSNI